MQSIHRVLLLSIYIYIYCQFLNALDVLRTMFSSLTVWPRFPRASSCSFCTSKTLRKKMRFVFFCESHAQLLGPVESVRAQLFVSVERKRAIPFLFAPSTAGRDARGSVRGRLQVCDRALCRAAFPSFRYCLDPLLFRVQLLRRLWPSLRHPAQLPAWSSCRLPCRAPSTLPHSQSVGSPWFGFALPKDGQPVTDGFPSFPSAPLLHPSIHPSPVSSSTARTTQTTPTRVSTSRHCTHTSDTDTERRCDAARFKFGRLQYAVADACLCVCPRVLLLSPLCSRRIQCSLEG